jgi:nucleoid-associated protein YgaU
MFAIAKTKLEKLRRKMATKHTIKDSDTLFKLAEAYYGDGNQWQKIKNANPGINENNLQVGQEITIPD